MQDFKTLKGRRPGVGIALWVLGASLGLASLPVAAETGPYIGAQIGLSTLSNISDTGFGSGYVGGGGFGYALPGHLRPELAVNFRHNEVKSYLTNVPGNDGSIDVITIMANLWYDFEYQHTYMYFGGGVGDLHATAHVSTSGGSGSDSDDVIAGQVGFGAGFFLTPAVSLGIDYRYAMPFKPFHFKDQGVKLDGQARTQSLMVGLRVSFGGYSNSAGSGATAHVAPQPVGVVPVQPSN